MFSWNSKDGLSFTWNLLLFLLFLFVKNSLKRSFYLMVVSWHYIIIFFLCVSYFHFFIFVSYFYSFSISFLIWFLFFRSILFFNNFLSLGLWNSFEEMKFCSGIPLIIVSWFFFEEFLSFEIQWSIRKGHL